MVQMSKPWSRHFFNDRHDMGEQFELNLHPTDRQPTESDPNADVDTMSQPELLELQASLTSQIQLARRTEPSDVAELLPRLERVEGRLAGMQSPEVN
jgi:hypothetical protein